MADFIFRISPNIVLGSYTTSRLGQFARDYGSKYIIIMDPILKEVGTSDKVIASLDDRKVEYFIYDSIPSGATTEAIAEAIKLAKEAHVHGVIAVGGSKALNAGRAVASLINESHEIYDYVDGAVPTAAPIPLICVPTTIRDAFMFTNQTPVIDSRSSRIKLLASQQSVCRLALIDPNLCVTLTDNQTASTSIETLCFAIEAYLSQKATFFSDMVTEKSFELLSYALDGTESLTITTPKEVMLSQGGCMASLGAASSSLGAASLLSLCINARYSISRSLVTSILLPYIIEDAATFKVDRLAKAAQFLRIAQADTPTEQAVTALTEYIRQHIASANLPARLKDLGVSIDQLALAAEDAGELDLINNLPRSMNTDDLFNLIKSAY